MTRRTDMTAAIALIKLLIITACIVLSGYLLTDGDLTKLTLFIRVITLLLLSLTLCRLFRRT